MDSRKLAFLIPAALVIFVAAAFSLSGSNDVNQGSNVNWTDIQLENVQNGEKFRISEFDKPVLVENFAVWCPTCTRQQQEVKKLHEEIGDEVVSVSLDTDPNEDAEKIRRHAARHSFNWRYAISPPEMTSALREEFGSSVLNPPSAPMILVCENGETRKLQFGVKPASKLKAELEKGC